MIDCNAIEVMGVLALVPAIYTGPAMVYDTREKTWGDQNRADTRTSHISSWRIDKVQRESGDTRRAYDMCILSDRAAGTRPEGSKAGNNGAERAIDQERSGGLRGVP